MDQGQGVVEMRLSACEVGLTQVTPAGGARLTRVWSGRWDAAPGGLPKSKAVGVGCL